MTRTDAADDRDLGANIRRARLAKGLTLQELADRVGVSQSTMSLSERGRVPVRPERLSQIAETLQIGVLDLTAALPDFEDLRTVSDFSVPGSWRHSQPLAIDRPLQGAMDCFVQYGYHGTSIREIAKRAGLSVPGVYHHYASKASMLVALLDLTMNELIARCEAARSEGATASERFGLLVAALTVHHADRRELSFIGGSEVRSLTPSERRRHTSMRRQVQEMLEAETTQAVSDGHFLTPIPQPTARAIIAICRAIPDWFSPSGPLKAEDLAAMYVRLAYLQVEATPDAPRGG